MRPLLLGEAPGHGGGFTDPLGKKTARRLCMLAGWESMGGPDPYRTALAFRFELRNLIDWMPPKEGKGRSFPIEDAKECARALDLRGRTIIALGKRVGKALELQTSDYFNWTGVPGQAEAAAVIIPHPSGINRVLNDPTIRERTGTILREVSRG